MTSNSLGFGTPRQTNGSNPGVPTFDYSGTTVRSGEDSHVDYRISPQYALTPNAMVYASWATAYIAGGISGATRDLLPPQENKTFELGAKTTWLNGSLRLNATLYKAKFENLLTTVFTIFNGVPVAQQIPGGSVEAKGIEFEGAWRATERLSTDFSVVANRAKYVKFNVASRTGLDGVDFVGADGRGYFRMDGKITPFSPELTAQLGLGYDIDLNGRGSLTPRLQAHYNSGYQTSRDNGFYTKQGGFTRLDLSATWTSADAKLNAQIFVNNATDELVSTSTDITPQPNFQAYADYEQPRTVGLRVSYKF